MSLLNDMLKDLAARQPAGGPAAVRPALPGRAPLRAGPLLLAVLLAGLIGAAAGYWWLRPAPVQVSTETRPVTLPAATPPQTTHTTVPAEPIPTVIAQTAAPTPRTPGPAPNKQPDQVTPTEPAPADTAKAAASRTPSPEPIKQPSRLSPAEQATAAYRDGLRLAQAGRPGAAAEQLAQAVRLQPDNAAYRLAQAQLLLRAGQGTAAARTLQDGIRRDPNALPLVKLYAGLAVSQNDSATALAALHGATPPTLAVDPAFHALLAAAEQSAGNYAAAADTYRALLAHNPAQGEWWAGLGIALENLGQPQDALTAYQHARQSRLPPAVAQYVSNRIAVLE